MLQNICSNSYMKIHIAVDADLIVVVVVDSCYHTAAVAVAATAVPLLLAYFLSAKRHQIFNGISLSRFLLFIHAKNIIPRNGSEFSADISPPRCELLH